MRKLLTLATLAALAGCVSAPANLARLEAECALAPLAEIGADVIPVPGVGLAANLTIHEVCANTARVARDEALVAAAIWAIVQRKPR